MTAVMYVFDYLFGFAVFGFLYWLLNGVLVSFRSLSASGSLLSWANYLWFGAVVIYLVFGVFWLPRKLKEWEYVRRL